MKCSGASIAIRKFLASQVLVRDVNDVVEWAAELRLSKLSRILDAGMPENHSSAAKSRASLSLLFSPSSQLSIRIATARHDHNQYFRESSYTWGILSFYRPPPQLSLPFERPAGHQPCLIPATNLASNSTANQPQAECHGLNHTRHSSPRFLPQLR